MSRERLILDEVLRRDPSLRAANSPEDLTRLRLAVDQVTSEFSSVSDQDLELRALALSASARLGQEDIAATKTYEPLPAVTPPPSRNSVGSECPRCGENLRQGVSFCTRCGAPSITPPPLVNSSAPVAKSGPRTLLLSLACAGGLLVAGGALAFYLHNGSSANASGPIQPLPVASTAQPAPTVTSTVIAVVTQTVNSDPQPDAAGGQARPSDWQEYIYSGPSEYDVCQSAAYPLNQTLSNGATPPEGSADYYTLVSAQAALRALNYGSPSLVVANGQFDGFLEQTIYGFQDRHKVPLTGVLDPATWSALNSSVHYWIGTCP